MLEGKIVPLDVTGDIATYKTAGLASMLVKRGVRVRTLMAENATHFINPMTSEGLTGNKCLVDTFDRNFELSVGHVALAKQTDVVMIAPASVNVTGRITRGAASGMLTTTAMAYRYKEILASAMNTDMYENPILQDNLDICRHYGMEVITSTWGYLARGDIEAGKMPEPEVLYGYILQEAGYPGDLAGGQILATAGLTREPIDPVRYTTNYSTGRVGYAIIRVAAYREAGVTLVSGPVGLGRPLFVETVPMESAREMSEAITARSGEQDIIVKAAAVANYRPPTVGTEKIKKSDGDLFTALERTDDVPGWLGRGREDGQFPCGSFIETQSMLENSRAKLAKKQVDMIVASNLKVEGAGFGTDTNMVTLITRGSETELPIMSKGEVANRPLIEILKRTKGQEGLNPA